MFEECTDFFVDLQSHQLVHLFHSLNQPQLSPGPGMGAEPSLCYLIVVKTQAQELTVFVGLNFLQSEKRLMYRTKGFHGELVQEKLAEAEAFVGEMGFLMNNTHYYSATQAEKMELRRTVPFFYKDMELFRQALRSSEIENQKAKAEVSMHRDVQAEQHRLFLDQYLAIVSML